MTNVGLSLHDIWSSGNYMYVYTGSSCFLDVVPVFQNHAYTYTPNKGHESVDLIREIVLSNKGLYTTKIANRGQENYKELEACKEHLCNRYITFV